MSDVLEKIKTRRSVKKYKPDMIPQDIIDKVTEAGLYAANGMGRQATIIIQVTNKEMRDKLSELNRQIGGWKEGFDPFYGAPAGRSDVFAGGGAGASGRLSVIGSQNHACSLCRRLHRWKCGDRPGRRTIQGTAQGESGDCDRAGVLQLRTWDHPDAGRNRICQGSWL